MAVVFWCQAEDVGGPGEPVSRRLTVEDGKVDDRMVLDTLKQAGGILAQARAPSFMGFGFGV